jgi:hypothetical protein
MWACWTSHAARPDEARCKRAGLGVWGGEGGVRNVRHALDLALALVARLGPRLAPRLALSDCCASACMGRSNGMHAAGE